MDIRLVIKRSVVYSALIGFFAAVFFGAGKIVSGPLEHTGSTAQDAVFIVTGLILVFVFQPVKRFLDRVTDKIFYRDKIDYEEILRRISSVISFEIDFDNLTRFLVEELSTELKLNDAHIFLANKTGAGMTLEASSDINYKKNRIPGDSAMAAILREERNLIIREELYRKLDDAKTEEAKTHIKSLIDDMEKYKAALALPVVVEGKLTAIIVLEEKRSGDIFSHKDLNLLGLMSQQVGTALQRARLYKEVRDFNKKLRREVADATRELQSVNITLQERNNFLLALQKITALMTRSLDYKKVVRGIVDGIVNEMRFVGGALFLIDNDTQEVFVEAISDTMCSRNMIKMLPGDLNMLRTKLDAGTNISVKAIREGKICIEKNMSSFSPNIDAKTFSKIKKTCGVKSTVAVPIISEEKKIGALVYYLGVPPENVSEPQMQVMKALADQTGIVTQNLRLYEEIQHVNMKLRDANENLKELDKAKSEFMSIASHQLRTPLSGIMGYLSMMVEGDYGQFKKDQMDILKNVLDASKRMIRLVNVFLNVTRIEAGRLRLERTEVDMSELVGKVVDELRPQAKTKGLKLTYKGAKDIPHVWIDADKITDVALNLTDNAIKYTTKGSITVSVEYRDGVIRGMVQDTGVGIPKEEAGKLFEKFVRGTGIARVQPDGSGLGLFIAKKVVEAHKGKIWVESDGANKGSRFIFELPVKENGPDAMKKERTVGPEKEDKTNEKKAE